GEFAGSNDVAAQKEALRSWMSTGTISQENRSYLRETRDLGATVGAGVATTSVTSSVFVPVGFDPVLSAAKKSYGQLVSAVRNWNTETSEPVKVAMYDDTEQLFAPIAEATAVTESDPNLSGFVSYVDPQAGGLVRISRQLVNDSNFNIDEFITEIFGVRLFAGLAKQIQLGNGSHIASIAANVPVVSTTAANTAYDIDSITSLLGALDPAYQERASFLMSNAQKVALMKLKDGYGHSLLQPDATGKPFSSIYGARIVISTYAPAFAPSAMPILYGDLSSYTLRTTKNLEIIRLVERYAEFDEIGFIGRLAGAGGYSTSQSVSPAIVGLQVHA
ncbi:MAG TPA: phage major capsid protein, partial [Ktedonobacteraceae bacterium]